METIADYAYYMESIEFIDDSFARVSMRQEYGNELTLGVVYILELISRIPRITDLLTGEKQTEIASIYELTILSASGSTTTYSLLQKYPTMEIFLRQEYDGIVDEESRRRIEHISIPVIFRFEREDQKKYWLKDAMLYAVSR